MKKVNLNIKNEKQKNFWNYFTPYEKAWWACIVVASLLLTIFYPEEMMEEGIGIALIIVCLVNIIANCTCELLISKQSKWNFIVSLIGIELTGCAIYFSLGFYASAVVSLLFWIPIDLISFFRWNKFKDAQKTELTIVKKLNWWQCVLIMIGVAGFACLWGFLLSPWIEGLLDGTNTAELEVDYFVEAISAGFGIANGVFILLRFREQWIAWLLVTLIEAYLWISSGLWVMLILTIGYLTNTVYGFIKWTQYIRNKNNAINQNEETALQNQAITDPIEEIENN